MKVTLNLSREEQEILIAILENYLSDLRMEISDTDRLDFRELLKTRKRVLRKTLDVLRIPDDMAAA